MAFPLSRKFLDKLREGKPEDSWREPIEAADIDWSRLLGEEE